MPRSSSIRRRYARPTSSYIMLVGVISLFAAAAVFLTPAGPAARAAAAFVVDSTGDGTDANVGDGVCADSDGKCTLRAAIQEANQLAGADTITFSVTGSIILTSALPNLSSMTISGPGPSQLTVGKDPAVNAFFRIFTTSSSSAVTISGLTVTGGRPGPANGGGIFNNQNTSLTLANVVVRGNMTESPFSTPGHGGGIYQDGSELNLVNSTVRDNASAEGAFGGVSGGRDGGGIYANRGVVNIVNSTITGNRTGSRAGFNGTGGRGGGLFVGTNASAFLTNSTVSGNRTGTVAAHGGGIYNNGGALTLNSCTVVDNSATGSGGGINGFLTIRNSIVANNSALNSGPDIFSSSVTSQDFNLIRNTSGATITGATAHDLTGVDPLLTPLQSNGGPTEEHALMPGSPAVDAGSAGDGGTGLATDQRGQTRPVDIASAPNASDGADIGAYEAAQIPAAGQIQFGASSFAATESAGQVAVTVTRTGGSAGAVSVTFSTANGTAVAGQDYATVGDLNVSFADGETSKTVFVQLNDDTTDEDNETVNLLLSNPAGGATLLGAPARAILTISDDDQPPAIAVSDLSAPEGDFGTTPFVFHVTLSAPSGKVVTAQVNNSSGTAISGGTDLFSFGGPGLVRFEPGETDKTVTMSVRGDLEVEPDEDFFVNVTDAFNTSNATASGRGVILNDDFTPTVSLSINDVSVLEGNTGTTDVFLTVSLSGPTTKTVIVDYFASGGSNEFQVFGSSLTFAPGETAKTILVRVIGDLRFETDEIVQLNLRNPRNALMGDDLGTVTIVNDEQPPTLTVNDVSITEGDTGTKEVFFTVTLSHESEMNVSYEYRGFPGTATENQDYFNSFGAGGVPAGVLRRGISFNVAGDTIPEAAETFFVRLTNVTGATPADPEGVCTIIDNDSAGAPPTFQFSNTNYSAQESAGETTITVTRSGDLSTPATVDYRTHQTNNTRSASDRSDYTAAAGTLRFAPGEGFKTFKVLLTDDAFAERDPQFGDEFVSLALSNPTGGVALGTPSAANLDIIDNDTVNGAQNPIDGAAFFVRQHYHDFLNREPDASGLAHWTNVANNCGETDLLVCRINVSGAFFLSIEFRETGYLVERIYKAAYGDATGTSTLGGTPRTLTVPIIRLEEFLPDTQRIGRDVVVLAPGWEAQLEANKTAFTQEFVQRQRFLDAFPANMTPEQFVDRLNGRAGGPLDAAERQALINELTNNNTTAGRASVLRKVAEDATLEAAEKNRAFVLMQYFGYLRRDPNEGRDTDYTGYDFWLGNLNAFNGNFVQAELVKAFITSAEYRQRFGP